MLRRRESRLAEPVFELCPIGWVETKHQNDLCEI